MNDAKDAETPPILEGSPEKRNTGPTVFQHRIERNTTTDESKGMVGVFGKCSTPENIYSNITDNKAGGKSRLIAGTISDGEAAVAMSKYFWK
jgi:hypothetical protein